jgi:ElaB/YqjD/DUF883 family membrane-anchored ribosome-binding protein
MATATEKDLKELKNEYASLKSHLADMSHTLANLTSDSVAEGRKRVRKVGRKSRDRTREAVDAIESTIEDHPIASLAITLGVGFLVAKLLLRD